MKENRKEMLSNQIRAIAEKDEDFVRAFVSCEDAAAVQKLLNDHGIASTTDEIDELFRDGMKELRAGDDELSEEQLENAAGGGFWKGTARFAASCAIGFGYGAFCAVCPPAYGGAYYVAGGLAVWTAAGYAK